MTETRLIDWLIEESKRELDRFLGIESPSKVLFEFGKEINEGFIGGLEAGSTDPDFMRSVEIMRHKQWLHYVALQRAPERKFKRARIRNGLM